MSTKHRHGRKHSPRHFDRTAANLAMIKGGCGCSAGGWMVQGSMPAASSSSSGSADSQSQSQSSSSSGQPAQPPAAAPVPVVAGWALSFAFPVPLLPMPALIPSFWII